MNDRVKMTIKDESGFWLEVIEGVIKDVVWNETHVIVEQHGGSFKMFNTKNVFSVEFNKG